MQFIAHLNFNGNCQAAFNFYEQALGGKIVTMMTHEGTPAAEHVPPEWRDKILHASLMVGDQWLMGGDVQPSCYQRPQGFSVAVHIKDPAEAERIFHALAEDGQVTMPLQETFWAARFGMLVDQFGIPWMVNCGKAG
jgi:PhnB protein